MNKPKYWRGIEELEQTQEFLAEATKEFPTDMSMEETLSGATEESLSFSANRRDFLKTLGFGLTAATLAACEAPVKKAIPYVEKPHDIIPGVANYYATTTPDGTPAVVKTREGRPIKLEGNRDSSLSKGGLSAIDQASLLDMYDVDRLKAAKKGSNDADWDIVDSNIADKLNAIKANGGSVRVLTGTLQSPSTQQIVNDFLGQFADGKHVAYDAVSASALMQAHAITFGQKAIPSYHFDKAMTIVSFSCDFLGTWLSPVGFTADYTVNRNPDKTMSRHLQFESMMSITGANADLRFPLNPSQQGVALLTLYNKIAAKLGKGTVPGVPSYEVAMNGLDKAAADLVDARGKSLVVCGTNNVAQQAIVSAINDMLGNYGNTLDISNPAFYRTGDDEAMASLVQELRTGKVNALLIYGANPIYDSPYAADLQQAMEGLDLSVSFATKEDATSALCQFTCPAPHFLESWGDARQTANHYSLVQPTIHPIFQTRQMQSSLLKWMGQDSNYHTYLQNYWRDNLFPLQTAVENFQSFWVETLRKGVFASNVVSEPVAPSYTEEQLGAFAADLKNGFVAAPEADAFEVVFYEKVGIRDGKSANNPWLQELPDPITRVTWDNYVSVPQSYFREKGLAVGDVMKVSFGGKELLMPVVEQPGQARNTIGIALGYGRTKAGRIANRANGTKTGDTQIAGANVYPYTSFSQGAVSYSVGGASLAKAGGTYKIARTQTFNTLYDPAQGVRSGNDFDRTERIIEETTSSSYKNGQYAAKVKDREERKKHLVTLWDSHFEDPETSRNIHWKMAIDLNKCTGCGACVVSCHAENNVPVVGKDEIYRRREMHWLRIDRYYSGSEDNPDVVFQPMLCQHCDNAPCETVCPVLATIHSSEGLNQMAYNRCVGTRYCANNCPYKVRRFNWFNYYNDADKFGDFYSHQEIGRLVLNPDVTVRFRGVMEKCSFCVQRLQETKLRAKVNANSTFAKPEDGDVQTACQQSCPTGAIVFGDFNDPNSAVSKLYREPRSYAALEDIKTLPSVQYMAVVRNRTEAETEEKEAIRKEVQTY